jgi:hypothetical protein
VVENETCSADLTFRPACQMFNDFVLPNLVKIKYECMGEGLVYTEKLSVVKN